MSTSKKDHSPAARAAFFAFHAAIGADRYRVAARRQPDEAQEVALEAARARMKAGGLSREEFDDLAARVARVLHLGRAADRSLPGFAPCEMPFDVIEKMAATSREHIYYTPLSRALNIILIDDSDPSRIVRMRREGIEPCFVQRSSPSSWQVVIKWPRLDHIEQPHLEAQQRSIEYLARVKIAQDLNARFGDPKLKNSIQPMRAPGTPNCKPKHLISGRPFIVEIVQASGAFATAMVERHAKAMREIEAEREQHAARRSGATSEPATIAVDSKKAALLLEIYKAHSTEVLRLCPALASDGSAVDLRIAQRMAAAGRDENEIYIALLFGAPNLTCGSQRRHAWEDYAARTVDALKDSRSVAVVKYLRAKYSKMFAALEAAAARRCDLSSPAV